MTRWLITLACLAAAFGGCATPLVTYDNAPSSDGAASPATPSPLPPNAFGPEVPHDFGSGGP